MPLARGFVAGVDQLGLVDEQGSEPAQQILLTGSYRNGTPRWVLVTFHADLPAKGQAVYRLVPSRPTAETPRDSAIACATRLPRSIRELPNSVSIRRSSVCSIRCSSATLQLVDQQARGGMILTDGSGAVWEDVHTTAAELEDGGPLSVVLAVRGELLSPDEGQRAAFVCRIQSPADKSEVRVFFTLRNPAAHAHPGNLWDLGSGGSIFTGRLYVASAAGFRRHNCEDGIGADDPPVAAG